MCQDSLRTESWAVFLEVMTRHLFRVRHHKRNKVWLVTHEDMQVKKKCVHLYLYLYVYVYETIMFHFPTCRNSNWQVRTVLVFW